ncbi:MAG TPA: hypothetical protein V6D26_19810 [Stenomitos sp.]
MLRPQPWKTYTITSDGVIAWKEGRSIRIQKSRSSSKIDRPNASPLQTNFVATLAKAIASYIWSDSANRSFCFNMNR